MELHSTFKTLFRYQLEVHTLYPEEYQTMDTLTSELSATEEL